MKSLLIPAFVVVTSLSACKPWNPWKQTMPENQKTDKKLIQSVIKRNKVEFYKKNDQSDKVFELCHDKTRVASFRPC